MQYENYEMCRYPEADLPTIHHCEQSGWCYIETLLTLEINTNWYNPQSNCWYPIVKSDSVGACQQLADASFKHSRRLADPNIDAEAAKAVRRYWIARNFENPMTETFMALSDKAIPIGFIQFREGLLWLVAVDPHYQGKQVGMALVEKAIELTAPEPLRVETQTRNLPALNLYTKMGFRVVKSEITMHRHG